MSCKYPGCTRTTYPGSEFCGKWHRDNYRNAVPAQNNTNNASNGATGTNGVGMICQYPGCPRTVYPGSLYCSRSHRDAINNGTAPAPGNANGTSLTPPGQQATNNQPLPANPVTPPDTNTLANSTVPVTSANQGNLPAQPGQSNQGDTCIYPGCTLSVFQGSAFCSKRHRDAMPNGGLPTAVAPNLPTQNGNGGGSQNSCHYPGCVLPVFPGSNFCSKKHRDAAPPGGGQPGATNPGATKPGEATCQYPGCVLPAFPGGSHCTKKHRDGASDAINKAAGMCLQCRNRAKNTSIRSDFCSKTCGQNALAQAPVLFQLPSGDENYQNVSQQFASKWIKATGHPKIHWIYKIYNPKDRTVAYETYRASVERQGNFKSRNLTEGNEHRRFHGTTRACTLGDNGKTALCQIQGCALCSIIRNSFQLNRAGSKHPWHNGAPGRFGRGIYTSATSAKAHDYQKNTGSSSYNAVLLNKVVVGKGKKLGQEDPTLTDPPPGYDSVIGEPSGANFVSDLNYDELIVYREEAIQVTYLVIYSI